MYVCSSIHLHSTCHVLYAKVYMCTKAKQPDRVCMRLLFAICNRLYNENENE